MTRHTSDRLLPLLLALLLPILLLPAVAQAEPDAELQQSLRQYFANGVVLNNASAQLVRVERWPNTAGKVRWYLPPSLRGHPKRFSLIAEQGKKRWYIPVRVHWWATAIVMKKSVPARSLLSKNMLKKIRTDIAGHSGFWWSSASDLSGMRLTRPLREGQVIFSTYVKRPPLIKRGDLVQIILDMGHLHVRAEGKAMRSAGRGERILVKNLRSMEIIQAIAEDSGTVRIKLRGKRG